MTAGLVLTGGLQVGKSTLLRRILRCVHGPWSGLFTFRLWEKERCIGYGLQIGDEPTVRIFAQEKRGADPSPARFDLDLQPFAAAAEAMPRLLSRPGLFVIDELGVFEQSCTDYCRAVAEASRRGSCLFVVQQRALDFWLPLLGDVVAVSFERENRRRAAEEILDYLKEECGEFLHAHHFESFLEG